MKEFEKELNITPVNLPEYNLNFQAAFSSSDKNKILADFNIPEELNVYYSSRNDNPDFVNKIMQKVNPPSAKKPIEDLLNELKRSGPDFDYYFDDNAVGGGTFGELNSKPTIKIGSALLCYLLISNPKQNDLACIPAYDGIISSNITVFHENFHLKKNELYKKENNPNPTPEDVHMAKLAKISQIFPGYYYMNYENSREEIEALLHGIKHGINYSKKIFPNKNVERILLNIYNKSIEAKRMKMFNHTFSSIEEILSELEERKNNLKRIDLKEAINWKPKEHETKNRIAFDNNTLKSLFNENLIKKYNKCKDVNKKDDMVYNVLQEEIKIVYNGLEKERKDNKYNDTFPKYVSDIMIKDYEDILFNSYSILENPTPKRKSILPSLLNKASTLLNKKNSDQNSEK